MSGTHGSHWLEREDVGKITIVRLKTARMIDEETVRDVFDPIKTLVELGRSQLVLNFTVVEYLPSMALGKLVMLNRKVQAANGQLVLCALNATIVEALENTHLLSLFKISGSAQEALQTFG